MEVTVVAVIWVYFYDGGYQNNYNILFHSSLKRDMKKIFSKNSGYSSERKKILSIVYNIKSLFGPPKITTTVIFISCHFYPIIQRNFHAGRRNSKAKKFNYENMKIIKESAYQGRFYESLRCF